VAVCETCGNDYDKPLLIRTEAGDEHVFDSFECAIHALAAQCAHCACKVLGHGVETNGTIYCCAHCAQAEGESGLSDRSDGPNRAASE
jgi:nitrite reductase/ring-hydroxylating ferredoxin subunit